MNKDSAMWLAVVSALAGNHSSDPIPYDRPLYDVSTAPGALWGRRKGGQRAYRRWKRARASGRH